MAEASGTLAQKLYAEQASQEGAEGDEPKAEGDDIVDAEFEEVDDDKGNKD